MSSLLVAIVFMAAVFGVIVFLNEKFGLLRSDHFSSTTMKVLAYVWLALFMLLLTVLIGSSSQHQPTARELAGTPFYSLFLLHAILVVFLAGWWLLTQRPPLSEFLSVRRGNLPELFVGGFAVGVAGWIFTITLAVFVALILTKVGVMPKTPEPPAMIAWMAALPLWKKMLIVLSAMTVEEAFFRGWLQKRVGLIASTVLFALAHTGFGQPLLLVGVSIISVVIGFAFYRTRSLIPGVVAHGVFDAVQLFVIIPIAFRTMGLG